MRAENAWKPSKFSFLYGVLSPSTDATELGIGSRLIGLLQAKAYQHGVVKYARGRLVDLGCGKVPLYDLYRARVSSVTCIDWPNSLHESPHIDIAADMNLGIPLPDKSADTVLCTDVLEHIRDPFTFCREIARILAAEGVAFITTPFMYWLHEEPHDHFRYTKHRLRGFAEDNGLEVLEISEYGGPLAVVLDVIAKNLPARYRSAYMKIAIPFYRSSIGQRLDERNRELFPIGYSLVVRKP